MVNVALAISPTERALRDRIDELEEEVRQYRDLLKPVETLPFDWQLEPSQIRLVLALAHAPGGYMSHEQLFRVVSVYAGETNPKSLVGQQVHRARRRLAPFHITINNRRTTGYEMPAASREIIRNAIVKGCVA